MVYSTDMVAELAKSQPGKLLRSGLRKLHEHGDPLIVGQAEGKFQLPPSSLQYAAAVLDATGGSSLGWRDTWVRRTLVADLDYLAPGKVEYLCSSLTQRLRGGELPSKDGVLDKGLAHETLPGCTATTTSQKEQLRDLGL